MPDASAHSTWPFVALNAARSALESLVSDREAIDRLAACADLLTDRFRAGAKVLAVGNGGSMCDAMHFAEEFTGRFRKDRPPLPVLACSDPSHLTCVANDFGFEHVFSRWVEGIGRPGDVLVALSTSGSSPNILKAVDAARAQGMHAILLLGKDGGRLRSAAASCPAPSFQWIVPGDSSDRIQELHMLILHTLIEGVERRLYPHLYERSSPAQP